MNSNKKIVAPPVYRPQPVPRVLMTKKAIPAPPVVRPTTPRQPARPPFVPSVMQRQTARTVSNTSPANASTTRAPHRCNPVAPTAHASKATIQRLILRLDSGNDVRKWEQRLAGKDKPGRNIMNPHVELRWMGNTEKLHVIAHSSDDFLSLENFYSPIELARKLINMGLPLNYRGQIVLHGCRSGLGGEDSFATKLQDALVDYGRRVPVKANIGTSKVLEDGSTRVMRVEDYYKYKALGDKLEKRWRSDLANEDKMLDYDLDHLDVPDAPTYQQHLQQQYGKTGKKLINKYFTRDYDRKQRLNRPDWSLRSAWGYTKGLASRAWDVIDGMSS